MTRAVLATIAGLLVLGLAMWPGYPPPPARAASVGSLQRQIDMGQGRISALSGAVGSASNRFEKLGSSIATLERQIAPIQAELDAKRDELLTLRAELSAARIRLARLESFEAYAESVLSRQLVSTYESDRPDVVTVVINATGFQDLLERLAFAQRIQKQDVQVVEAVRAARRAVASQATRLGALEVRQQIVTAEALQQRNTLAGTRLRLEQQQLAVAQSRDAKAAQLGGARAHVAILRRQLSQIEAAQAAAAARAALAARGTSPSGGASVSSTQVASSGGFTFPLPTGTASPPGSWSLDLGVDLSAAGGTPELAVCSGTIVLHGIGGFGPWAPVLHCDSTIAGYSYVYYGHAGPANQLPVGTHVGAGQVMSEIGPGIVGISTGPHIEIGFADASGSPIGAGSAPTMMSLLRGAYGG
jgi:murein DD-endopeptidase MepM/ murein hydrolase activator NlpD